jgi:hypothetical protein
MGEGLHQRMQTNDTCQNQTVIGCLSDSNNPKLYRLQNRLPLEYNLHVDRAL